MYWLNYIDKKKKNMYWYHQVKKSPAKNCNAPMACAKDAIPWCASDGTSGRGSCGKQRHACKNPGVTFQSGTCQKSSQSAFPNITPIKYFENTNECPTGYTQVECTQGNTNFSNCGKPNVIACSNGKVENRTCPANYTEKLYPSCLLYSCPASAFSCIKQTQNNFKIKNEFRKNQKLKML
jgi:hypothetical protein